MPVRSLATILSAMLLAGCTAPAAVPEGGGAAVARVTGIVTYRERVALPPTAVIKVQLVDVSRADAPASVLNEQVIRAGGKHVPFAFAMNYDAGRIETNHTYAVQARIEDDGKLRFINDQRYVVITRGAPTHVELLLKSVGSAGAP